MKRKERAEQYTLAELMVVAAARELKEGERVLVGLGLPLLAATFAKMAYTPRMEIVTEIGVFDWRPNRERTPRAPISIGDPVLFSGSAMLGDMVDALGCALMGGHIDVALLAAAQIDKYGNLNTICLGDYRHPEVKFGGTGGNTDAACLAKRVITIMPQERRRFVEKVDFLSSPGYIDGPGARERHGLDLQGPNAVVTTLGVYRFDTPDGGRSGTCQMYLDALFHNFSPEEVQAETGWDLMTAPAPCQVELPTKEELKLLSRLDPYQLYLRAERFSR